MTTYYTTISTNLLGPLILTAKDNGLTGIYFHASHFRQTIRSPKEQHDSHPILQLAKKELTDYFLRKRTFFTVRLILTGTPFQQNVWEEVQKIPYGTTATYQDIAMKIGNKKAVRAVGQANKANQIPIIIPCHRVIGKNNNLVGYAGKQVDKKQLLLELEGAR